MLSLTESGRTELSAWGLALDSNLPDLNYHEGQLSGGAKLLDTGVKLSPIVGAAATAGGSKAAQALAGKKTPTSLADNRQPSVVDGEMAGDNKQSKSKIPTLGTRIDNQVSIINKQSLPSSVVANFKNSEYQTVITNEPVTVYRKFGGGKNQAKLLGGYTTTIPNASRQETAVYTKWSTSQFEAEIEIPKGQVVNIGKVGQQPPESATPKYRGGEDQILMPRNYPISWVKSIRDGKTGKSYSIEEFIKKFPNQVK